MKKTIAALLALTLLLAFAACGKTPEPTDADTTAGTADETTAPDQTEETTEIPSVAPVYATVTYGRITAMEAPATWEIAEESADWRIVYVQPDEEGNKYPFDVPTVQLTTDEDGADRLVARVKETKGDEPYTEEEITVAGVRFVNIVPELGFPAMYGTVDGQTLVVTYTKGLDLQSDAVSNIIASVRLAPAAE